jgi:ATP/ADP translocase
LTAFLCCVYVILYHTFKQKSRDFLQNLKKNKNIFIDKTGLLCYNKYIIYIYIIILYYYYLIILLYYIYYTKISSEHPVKLYARPTNVGTKCPSPLNRL